jgi:predicted RNA-binding protein with RPS1 domain
MVRHNYPIGARVRGKVRNMTTYGAFIELEEGIDGLLHVSDMSWTKKITHPSAMLKKGDDVEAVSARDERPVIVPAVMRRQYSPQPGRVFRHDSRHTSDVSVACRAQRGGTGGCGRAILP